MIEQPETESEQLRRMVSETYKNIQIIKQQVEKMYGVIEEDPAGKMEDTAGYYDCPECGHRVTEATFKLIRMDYVCPGCYNKRMSQFIHHPEVKQDEQ